VTRLPPYDWDDLAAVIEMTGDAQHRHIPGSPDEYRHGYIPLTPAAAKSHGHGKVPKGWRAPGGSKNESPTHTGLYHATPAANAASIRREGFRAASDSGQNGAFFGAGTYFHTHENDAKESLEGYRAFIDSSMEHVRANATVHNPFTVPATSKDHDPGQVMHRALAAQGVTVPGEHLSPAQVTARLKALGYDGVEVRQDGFNHDIGGSQLVAFDPSQIQVQP
jgi:hypothetical protein